MKNFDRQETITFLCIGAAVPRDPWNASPPTLDIMGTKRTWSPNFCNCLSFFAVHCERVTVLPRTSLTNLRGEEKKSVGKGIGRNMGGAIRGDGKKAEEEKEEDRHPPHVRSPPTFQPWLRQCFYALNTPVLSPTFPYYSNHLRISRGTARHLPILVGGVA